MGITDEQLAHLGDERPPAGLFSPSEEVIVRYARQSTLHLQIDDDLFAELSEHFTREQIIDLCLIIGMSNVINRFHATFKTDVDQSTLETILAPGTCPLPLPALP